MRILSIGGGPAGLYFAILAKRADPRREIVVLERNRPGDTFGFGVVFSDRTLDNLATADPPSHAAITAAFAHWDDIDVHWRGEVVRSRGHGFAGLERRRLLEILTARAEELGVEVRFATDVAPGELPRLSAEHDLVLGADGVNSTVRAQLAGALEPRIDWRPNRFVWLGTTFPFPAFTFLFNRDDAGLWRVHAYRYAEGQSTFIVECTEATWRAAGMDRAGEDETIAYLERLFAPDLGGHRLLGNRSLWRQFPTVTCARWSHENVVLLGDAAHTAHFSIGSGTKLALEDAIELHRAFEAEPEVPRALAAYEAARRPTVASTQRAAQVSLEWFEVMERYRDLAPLPFAFSLLTRSLRVTHGNLKLRDPELVARVDRDLSGVASDPPPPMFTRFTVRGVTLANRVVVSPMCQYSAVDGTPGDWHLVHLGSRALGGAGLVFTEGTAVSPEGRITHGDAGIYDDRHVAAWGRIVDFVRRSCDVKLGMQLEHAGRKASTQPPWLGDRPLRADERPWPTVAASAIPYGEGWPVPAELDRAGMAKVRDDHARAARRAREAGFDVLELHFAHGYLAASFLSPLSNRRGDAYGGALENRVRFPCEIVAAVREVWPGPLFARISAVDWAPGGTTPEEAVEIARALAAAGVDVIDVSSGGTLLDARPAYGRLYQTMFADRIRHQAGLAVMTVGGVASWDDVNSVIAARRADLVALAREHLYDPYFTRHAAAAQRRPQTWPDPYQWALGRYDPPRR
jgi:anthraniloyl-CoA monooxygenase